MKSLTIFSNIISICLTSTIILFILLIGTGVKGEEIIVDAGGEGDYMTIREAIDNAGDGDTIHIEPGEYHEEVSIEKAITLKGRDRDSTIIDGSGRGKCIEVSGDHTVISELTLRNGDFGLYLDKADECRISNLSCKNMDFEGIHLGNARDNRIENISISNCSTGIRIFSSSGTEMDNIGLQNNSDYQAFFYASQDNRFDHFSAINGSKGFFFFNSDNNTLENGRILFNTESGITCSSSVNISIKDAIFLKNSPHDLGIDKGTFMVCHNISGRDEHGMQVPITYSVEEKSELHFHADLIFTVLNASGIPVPGVNASIECQNESGGRSVMPVIIQSTTDTNGTAYARELRILTVNESASSNVTYTIKLEKELWNINRSWKASSSQNEVLKMKNSEMIDKDCNAIGHLRSKHPSSR